MDRRTQPRLLPLWIGILLASWPFNIVLGKIALRYFPSVALASFRLMAAAAIMPMMFVLTRGKSQPFSRSFTLREIRRFCWLAICGVILNQGCFIIGLNRTSAAHSAFILATGPIAIFVLAWLQELEAATWRKVSGLALAFSGVIVLTTEKGLGLRSPNLLGDIITLFGATGFALYTVSARKLIAKCDAVRLTTLAYLLSAVIVGPIAIFEAVNMSLGQQWNSVPIEGWLAFGYIAISGSVMAFLIYTWTLRYLVPSRVGALTYVHPLIASSLAVVWLGEPVTPGLIIGGSLIMVGLYLTQFVSQMSSRGGRQDGVAAQA